MKTAGEFGLDSRMVDGAEISELLPMMEGSWIGGMYTPSDGHAEPKQATEAFARAAEAAGAVIHPSTPVEEILVDRGKVTGVRTSKGTITADHIVSAAGAASTRVGSSVGLGFPIQVVRSSVVVTAPVPPVTTMAVWSPALAFRQRNDGAFVLAAAGTGEHDITLNSFRHLRTFLPNYWKNRELVRLRLGKMLFADVASLLRDPRGRRSSLRDPWPAQGEADESTVADCLAEQNRLFPDSGPYELGKSWAGFIDATPDARPVLGFAEAVRGFVFATGFSGHGFGMGPLSGQIVSELIVDGESSHDLHPFRYERFAEGDIGEPRSLI